MHRTLSFIKFNLCLLKPFVLDFLHAYYVTCQNILLSRERFVTGNRRYCGSISHVVRKPRKLYCGKPWALSYDRKHETISRPRLNNIIGKDEKGKRASKRKNFSLESMLARYREITFVYLPQCFVKSFLKF